MHTIALLLLGWPTMIPTRSIFTQLRTKDGSDQSPNTETSHVATLQKRRGGRARTSLQRIGPQHSPRERAANHHFCRPRSNATATTKMPWASKQQRTLTSCTSHTEGNEVKHRHFQMQPYCQHSPPSSSRVVAQAQSATPTPGVCTAYH
jgi:hypothetical protein